MQTSCAARQGVRRGDLVLCNALRTNGKLGVAIDCRPPVGVNTRSDFIILDHVGQCSRRLR